VRKNLFTKSFSAFLIKKYKEIKKKCEKWLNLLDKGQWGGGKIGL